MRDPTSTRAQHANLLFLIAVAATSAAAVPALADPFDRCGTFVQGLEWCVVFETDGDAVRVRPDLTPPALGTRVRIQGDLVQCASFCFVPCVEGAISSQCLPTPVCGPDFDLNGVLSANDIFAFLTAWFAGNLGADFDQSGALGVPDIFDFINAWFAGCP